MGWVWYRLGQVKTNRLVAETGAQTQTLEAGMRAKTSLQQVVLRSRIYLLAAEGLPPNAMVHRWETSRPTVGCGGQGSTKRDPSGLSSAPVIHAIATRSG